MNIDFIINDKLNLLILTSFMVLGLYYYINSYKYYEPLENNTNSQCPNMLIEKDGKYHLFNLKKIVSGVNPITFNNLEDYTKFIEWQNNKNISCPILYLQYSTDAQNNELIQVKSSIFENEGGLPSKIKNFLKQDNSDENQILDATKDNNGVFNTNMFNGFDSQNQDIGLDTPLDKIFHQPGNKSVNPMDPHWGGKNYTLDAVNRGDFEERYVYKKPHEKLYV